MARAGPLARSAGSVSRQVTWLGCPSAALAATVIFAGRPATGRHGPDSAWRQSEPVSCGERRGRLSVERVGTVKRTATTFPTRLAAILVSATGVGRNSEGACGGPGLA